jgi:hypothetical protein
MNHPRLKSAVLVAAVAALGVGVSLYALSRELSPNSTPLSVSFTTPLVSISPVATFAATTTQPKITWSTTSVNIILSPGESTSSDLTFTSSQNLTNVTLGVVPQIAPFVAVQPSTISSLAANQTQSVHLSMAIAAATAFGTYDGTLRLKSGATTFPQTLKVSLSVVQTPLILAIPPGFQANSAVITQGGPIALNNFGNHYQEGGIIPAGGAEIDVTSLHLPHPPLDNFIANELEGATIVSSNSVVIAGSSGTEVVYTDSYTPTLTYKNIAVYVPHAGLLYKFYLSYRAGDSLEGQFVTAFQQILSSIQFAT